MGREIRRVPLDWQHPKRENGSYQPLYDEDYESAAAKWITNFIAWDNGTHKDLTDDPTLKTRCPYYWDWNGGPPDKDYHRPTRWKTDPTGYQVYENVSEGTPTSPIFETLEDMKTWLLSEGYSEHAADRFIEYGWAMSMVFTPEKGMSKTGIHSWDHID